MRRPVLLLVVAVGLVANSNVRADRRLDDEKRLPVQKAEARIWCTSSKPPLTLSITAGAEACDGFQGEALMYGGNSGQVQALVCFGPEKPTGDVELVSALGDDLSMHYLVFTFDRATGKVGYSLKRIAGAGSFDSTAFSFNVASRR